MMDQSFMTDIEGGGEGKVTSTAASEDVNALVKHCFHSVQAELEWMV
jgi:hypothetical protein